MTSLARIAVLGLSCTALSVGAEQTAHPRVVLVRLQDDTDSHNELVFETEYLLEANEKPFEVAAAREKGMKLSVSVADRLDFIWVKIK